MTSSVEQPGTSLLRYLTNEKAPPAGDESTVAADAHARAASPLERACALLKESAPLPSARWPSPCASIESAAAFVRSRRPGKERESEREDLLLSFYPLSPKTLSRKRLRASEAVLLRAYEYIRDLHRTEAADRFRHLKSVSSALALAVLATRELISEQPPGTQSSRRKIDRWSPQLRAVVNISVAVDAKGYVAPSVPELLALAVLQCMESPTGNNRDLRALREAKWKKIRSRALKHFRANRAELLEARKAWEHRIELEVLDKLESKYAREAREKAESDRSFARALMKQRSIVAVLRGERG